MKPSLLTIPIRLISTKPPSVIIHKESRILPFSSNHLYTVIKDVTKYNEFIPFCKKGVILSEEVKGECTKLVAEVTVGAMGITDKYLSDAYCKPNFIHIMKNEKDRTFKQLDTQWKMEELSKSKTKLDFSIRFELKNTIYNYMIGLFKNMLVYTMNSAFIERARILSHNGNNTEELERELKESTINARLFENIHCLFESKKLSQEEHKQLVKMIGEGVIIYELQAIDRAYGGSEDLQDMYVVAIRKLLNKYHNSV